METTTTTVRVIQYPTDYDFDLIDATEATKRFSKTVLVTNDGVSTHNKDGTPVTAEGGGVLMVVDRRPDASHFPELFFVMGVRQPSVADWYTGDASVRTLQVEPSSGWVADEDKGGFVHTAIAETREEVGYPIWSGPLQDRLLDWSTYQPFTGKRICTFGLVLRPEEIPNLTTAARAISYWPADETRYYGDFTGRPLVSHTTKLRVDSKTGKETVITVSETGLRKSLQGLGLVKFSDVGHLFAKLETQTNADREAWEKATLAKFTDIVPHLAEQLKLCDVHAAIKLIAGEPIFAERTKEEREAFGVLTPKQTPHGEASDVLRSAKRGFNPLDSAKKLGQTPEGKVPVYLLADTTVQEQDPSSKEPKAKKTRVAQGTPVQAMIRAHILLNLQSRWADIQKI